MEDAKKNELDLILKNDVVSRHSYFQLKYFILGKEPTTQAKLWQCLRELKSRKESLRAVELEIEDSKDNLELIEIKIQEKTCVEVPKDDLNSRKNEIALRKLKRKKIAVGEGVKRLIEKKKNIEEETIFFIESFKNLELVEALKPFDDFEAQKEYWGTKFSNKINLKMLLQNPLDIELVESVLALPDDIQIKGQMVKKLDAVQQEMIKLKESFANRVLKAKS